MDEMEKENERKRTKDRSPSPEVKSTAVVKYTAYHSPVGYARLQCNTDLNLPPSNWGTAIDSYGLKQILTESTGLSSFRMAHMFPDSVGEVDVISGAECIKKLLKLPYHPNGTVSMMVHRVENTLLLDDFDVYDYLSKTEWSWLKDFFYENILKTMSEQERMKLSLAPGPSSALQLTHKFLSHSVTEPVPSTSSTPAALPAPVCIAGPFLPEPETKPEEPPNEHLYNRNVLWTFEDIHMLIGSDLPIFGDKDRPCVSLRLRDAREPINVLTGIDYWLDNLMCNVPEVLMCYHLDGIVQKYEPMKTEDLPTMENSKFSPKVIRNVAQNILSFLKANVTKAGHTYWLFKGSRDDIVKLYDLSSLCPDSLDNPFTTPVAMLLYRVARNMRLMNKTRHVKQLLEHVIELLKMERHPQIVASSYYMLSDLYVPATTNPACPNFKDESSESDCGESDYKCEFAEEVSGERDETTSDQSTSEFAYKTDSIASDTLSTSERNNTSKRLSDSEKGENKTNEKDDESEGDNHSLAVQIRGLALRDIGDRVRNDAGMNWRGRSRGPGGSRARAGEGSGVGAGARSGVTSGTGTSTESAAGDDEVPSRCGHALAHALQGLIALHNVTIQNSKEEERERLRQQIIVEEQHPKMANPYEPIKMEYQPINKEKATKEHTSRSRRRRREKKTTDKSGNYLIETKSKIDINAILIRKDKNTYHPTWQEPSRDDNFAWKLHLKTLLYEKICLVYATLAEYSYSNKQYGFSLKYIDMASKCQKLLSNMIIKSRVVDPGCLIGRVGDNFFQLSKNWPSFEQFKKQFETDHDIDSKLRLEIENDMTEEVEGDAGDEFDLDISLPNNEMDSMLRSGAYYRRAANAACDKRGELQRRLASVNNELAVRYMNDAQQIYMQYTEEEDQNSNKVKLLKRQFATLSRFSCESLEEATAIFQEVNDVPNLALLYCNKGRYMRFKALCSQGSFGSEKRSLYNKAEELYNDALKLLGPRETCGAISVWDLVAWELSCHLYTKAVLMQDSNISPPPSPSEVADALKQALKHCLLGGGPRQHLYQFRAGLLHHRLASLHHAQYRITTEDGPKRRTLLNATRNNYELAANLFAILEDACMFLTVQMEHVAALETQAALSPNVKLKSLQTAIQLLRQCHSIMKLIKVRGPDQKEAPKPEDADDTSIKSELGLLSLYEGRLHFILKSIIQYCRSKSNKDYEKMSDMYKKLYCASLKIKKDNDVQRYAASICDVLTAMDVISKEFE
ncbi:erythroid differentiation-related factor 1 [Galleria mellonella]|uniref:Erythroid differentiation-related factor 1 n=1 Tax=Galleria mellonella TaxID=7137 RepID=A0A6J1WIG6_GALME|nr:erythroid differentiation-related factor 1 [Galleria mellonella]XP_026754167.1 erythroid differentiation-related factor 1 [Galleria mellonella]